MTEVIRATVPCNPLPPQARTVVAMLQRQACEFGRKPLLEIGAVAWCHADAALAAARRAAALRNCDIGHGDRVALMSSNRIEFLEVFLGSSWLGAVTVPVNTASMGPQIGYFLAHSGARLLVIEQSYLGRLAQANLAGSAGMISVDCLNVGATTGNFTGMVLPSRTKETSNSTA